MPTSGASIEASERISRFIHQRDNFTQSTGNISFRVFLPPNNGDYTQELSVFRTEGLDEPRVWSESDALRPGALARADFRAACVPLVAESGCQLELVPDNQPPGHALIAGWPPADSRDLRKLLAMRLRDASQPALVVR